MYLLIGIILIVVALIIGNFLFYHPWEREDYEKFLFFHWLGFYVLFVAAIMVADDLIISWCLIKKVDEQELEQWTMLKFFLISFTPMPLIVGYWYQRLPGPSYVRRTIVQDKKMLVAALISLAVIIFMIVSFRLPLSLELTKKIKESSELKERLENKKQELSKSAQKLEAEIKELQKEIKAESKKNSVSSYEEARENQRIIYDLALIQSKQAYRDKLYELIGKISLGIEELLFLQRKYETDYSMSKVMERAQMKELRKAIKNVISQNQPQLNQLQININEENLPSQQDIWQEIMSPHKK